MHNPAPLLIRWYQAEGRHLPWRETRDPYFIWLSEIILQQTRIDQGTAYYLRFTERFPSVHDLAAAPQDEVMKLWEGLGYYSRARNLHHTAKVISQEMGGAFPETWQELMQLKGIGPYTARAIGSFAFGNRAGVLDGNVFRVLSRYLADFSPIDLPATRKHFQTILDSWVQQHDPADFNQGMMDLGSMVCTPRQPQCAFCPLSGHCKAYAEGIQEELPVKAKKLKRSTRYLNFYLVGTAGGRLMVRKRPATGLWANLYELPNQEVEEAVWNQANQPGYELLGAFKHVLTHIDLMIKVYRGEEIPGQEEGFFIPLETRSDFAFSRAVLKIFERYLPGIT